MNTKHRERDRLWCQALVAVLDIQQINEVLVEFNLIRAQIGSGQNAEPIKLITPGQSMESMDIHSKPGTQIIFAYPGNGMRHDQKVAEDYLEVGKEYTVKMIRIENWHSYVWLEEFPNKPFNSVMFSTGG